MTGTLSWEDPQWVDPDGGKVILHGVLPTVVFSQQLRPREKWQGLGLMANEEEEEAWDFEEKSEKESPGINLTEAMLGGGITHQYLERLLLLEDITAGRFPDPEPNRLLRIARRSERSIHYLEPSMSDPEWADHLIREAEELTRWRTLLRATRQGGRYRKRFKAARVLTESPPDGSEDLQVASALAHAWWEVQEEDLSQETRDERDLRIAARMRGALADLRAEHGDNAVLLVPILQTRRGRFISILEEGVEPEIAKSMSPSDGEEE